MSFNEVMALIMPSIVALLFYTKMSKNQMTWFEVIGHLALFMLITNAICYGILVYFGIGPIIFSMLFTMEYSFMALIIALVVAILYRLVQLNVKFKMKVESIDEKE